MRYIQRILAALTLAPSLLVIAQPTLAYQTCCACRLPQDPSTNICIQYSDAQPCDNVQAAASSTNNASLAALACDAVPLPAWKCREISDPTTTAGVCSIISTASRYGTGAQTADEEFKPVIPNLEIDIPGLNFADEFQASGGGPDERVSIPFLAQYISAAYKYLVGISVIAAAVMIVYGGFLYIIGGTFTSVNKGKDIIWDAVIGLFLVFALFTIINTLNPEITSLKSLDIHYVATEPFSMEELEDWGEVDISTGAVGKAQAICNSIESCRQRCIDNDWPTEWPGVMNPDLVKKIPDIEGALVGNGIKASDQVIQGLTSAAWLAREKGYTIVVTSGYRPLRVQISKVCNTYIGNPALEPLIGSGVAYPGSSNHGTGSAVDVALIDNKTGKRVVKSGDCRGQKNGTSATPEASKILDEIMTSSEGGDGVRYSNETWHYEFGSSSSCRCKFPNCPAPPRSCNAGCGN